MRNHGELCAMLNQHVVPESLASQGLMNIMVKTQELLEELNRLRLEFVRLLRAVCLTLALTSSDRRTMASLAGFSLAKISTK